MNRWTLHVTDFGKIKQADVQVAPMTLFLGDNNSGKSYLMTLIYGLLNLKIAFWGFEFDKQSTTYKTCRDMLKDVLDKMDSVYKLSFSLTQEQIAMFEQLLNSVLQKNQRVFLRQLFNREVEAGEITIHFPESSAYSFEIESVNYENKGMYIIYGKSENRDNILGCGLEQDKIAEDDYCFLLSYIMEFMLKSEFQDMADTNTVFFPTARTGYLLTYRSLVQNAMQEMFSEKETIKNLLTRPNTDFLTMLSSMRTDKKNDMYADIVCFIEQQLIKGNILVSDLPTHEVMYVPEGNDKQLPMYMSSGVVTELAPLVLFLKYKKLGTLLIEEPEIGLHPELHVEMARLLIRIKNAGTPVFVTTHSDIIIQHINNMMRLAKSDNNEKIFQRYGFEEEDIIHQGDVAVYQFDVQDDARTVVSRVACGDYGFEARTFYNTLEKINNLIMDIDNLEE